jgi:excisionase family DNA binding protein
MTHTPAPILLQIPEAAASLGLGKTKFWELVHDGRIEVVRIGRRALVARSELERFAESLSSTSSAPGQ